MLYASLIASDLSFAFHILSAAWTVPWTGLQTRSASPPPLLFWQKTPSPQLSFSRVEQILSFLQQAEFYSHARHCPALVGGGCQWMLSQHLGAAPQTLLPLLHYALSPLAQIMVEHYICTLGFFLPSDASFLFLFLSVPTGLLDLTLYWWKVALETLLELFIFSLHKPKVVEPKNTAEIIRVILPGNKRLQSIAGLLFL